MQWFRFYDEAIDDQKLIGTARERSRTVPETLGVWTILLSLANRSHIRGTLAISETKPHTANSIAGILRSDEQDAQAWLDAFVEYGLLTLNESLYAISNWSRRQFASDDVTARTRATKERSRNVVGTDQRQTTDSEADTDTETHKPVVSPSVRQKIIDRYGQAAKKPLLRRDLDTLNGWIEDYGEAEVLEAINIALQEPRKNLPGFVASVLANRRKESADQEVDKFGRTKAWNDEWDKLAERARREAAEEAA